MIEQELIEITEIVESTSDCYGVGTLNLLLDFVDFWDFSMFEITSLTRAGDRFDGFTR